MKRTTSRRELVRRANGEARLAQEVLKTLAAILIEQGPIIVKRENLLLATDLRVDCTVDAHGNQIVRLQDTSGRNLDVDQSVHADADCRADDASHVGGQVETVHGV